MFSDAVSRFADLGHAVQAAGSEADDQTAAAAFVDALGSICWCLEVPTLRDYGIDQADFFAHIDKMADDALASGSPANTIRPVNKEDECGYYLLCFPDRKNNLDLQKKAISRLGLSREAFLSKTAATPR